MKSARNHPQQGGVPAGKHNIGHHGKQLWRWMAGSGGGGGAGVGGGAWGGSQPPRASHWPGCSTPPAAPLHRHLWPTCPSSPESTCPASNICHSCTNICLSHPPHICFPHIFVFLIYLSRPNICHGPMFLSITYLFLRVGVFSLFRFQVTGTPVYFVRFHFCEIVQYLATTYSPWQGTTRPNGLIMSKSYGVRLLGGYFSSAQKITVSQQSIWIATRISTQRRATHITHTPN